MPTRAASQRDASPFCGGLCRLCLSATALLASPAAAQTAAELSSVGSIVIPIEYSSDAEADASGVLLLPSHPPHFPVGYSPDPLSLTPSQVRYQSFPYSALGGEEAGPFPVSFSYPSLSGVWERELDGPVLVEFEVMPHSNPQDTLPPNTTLRLGGTFYSDGNVIYVSSGTTLRLTSADPLTPLSPASGVAETRYLLETVFVDTATTPGLLYAGQTIEPPGPGVFSLSWYSVDNSGNVERVKVSSLAVDGAAPAISGILPSGGEVFGLSTAGFTALWAVTDALTPFSSFATLVQVEDRGVPIGTAPAQVPASLGQPFTAGDLDDGLWELRVTAADFVLNASSEASGPFEIIHAAPGQAQPEPPSPAAVPFPMVGISSLTMAWVSTTNAPGALYYAQLSLNSNFSNLVRSSETHAFDATFVGLSPDTNYHARVAVYQPFRSTWSAFSPLGSTTTIGDRLPPRSTLLVGTPSIAPEGPTPLIIGPSTPLWLEAEDDLAEVFDRVGLGVAAKSYKVSPSTAYIQSPATFTIASDGLYTVDYFSTDVSGNAEAPRLSSVAVDATRPVVAYSITGSRQVDRLGRVIVSTATDLNLLATDPVTAGVASGVGSLRWTLNGGLESFALAASTSLRLPEGPWALSVRALDRVENASLLFTTTVIVEASPPDFGAASAAPAGGIFQPTSIALSTTTADASIQVSDLASGLDVTGTGVGPAPLTVIPGTLGLWHFDEGTGLVAGDAAGVAGPGTLNPGVVWVPGKIGQAVRVSDTGALSQGVTLAPSAFTVINNMSAGTIELWGKLIQGSANANHHTFTTKQHNGSDTMFYFGWEGNSMSLRWQASNGSGSCLGNYPTLNQEWHHFAVTWTASSSRLYLDGALLATCGGAIVPNDPNPTCLSIAGGCGDGATTGKRDIDEVRVLNVALSAAQIAQDAAGQAGAFSARVSVNGGQSFTSVGAPALSLTGTDGTTSTKTLTARGLTLAASTGPADGRNVVEFSATDMSGRVGSARRTLLVNLSAANAPLAALPAPGAAVGAATTAFSWSLASAVPAASITGYELDLATKDDFSEGLLTLYPTTTTFTTAVADGRYWWRVRARDAFGSVSPNSTARQFSVDTLPPVFGQPELASASSDHYRGSSLPTNSNLIDVRASLRDLGSGLRVTPLPGGPQPTTVTPNTLGLWHFDEMAGTTASGSGTPAGNGTLNPGVVWVAGKIGGAVRVSGDGSLSQGVTLAPPAYTVINNMSAGTIELWGKLIQGSLNANHHTFTTKQHNGSDTMFYFGWEGNSMSLRWQASNGSGSCLGNYPTLNQEWHHFAVTWTASASRLYLDGALLATCGGAVVPNDPAPTCLSIAGGCADGATTGKRDIDEVRVLNVALSSAQIALDAASPPGAIAFSAAVSTNGGTTFLGISTSAVTLTGVDGSTGTETFTARGLALVESASLTSPLNLVRLTASDLAGKTTTLAFAVLVDTTPPVVAVSSPAAGSAFSTQPLVVHAAAADRLDPAPALTARLVQIFDVGGNGELDTLWVSTGTPVDVSQLDAGSWTAVAEAVDFAGNVSSAVSGVFRIERDILPPRTDLLVLGPRFGDSFLFVTPRSSLTLSSVDDLLVPGDEAGVGVAGSSYSIDSNSLFADYTGPFSISEESVHDVRYFSRDAAGHLEGVKLASVAVDGTGPGVALAYHAPFRVLPGTTTVFVRGLGTLALSATDYPALAVGTTATFLSVDGGVASAVDGPFSLPEGLKALAIWGVDALGNQGATVTASLKLDATPPSSVGDLAIAALSSSAVTVSWTAPGDDGLSGDLFDAAVSLDFGGDLGALLPMVVLSSGALAAGTRMALTFDGLASGTTYYARVLTRDTAGNIAVPSPLASGRTFSVALSQDGVASFTSPVPAEVILVSTLAEAHAYTVAVASQGLAPAGDVFYELTSGLVFSTAAPAVISFTFDPALVDAASVRIYTYNTAAQAWTSTSIFNQTLTQLDGGLYRISGEILHTSLYAPMVRDTVPPFTAFTVSGQTAVLEGHLFARGGASGVLSAEDRSPKGGAASGVAGTRYQVGQEPETAYQTPFPLPEGVQTVTFHSQDRAANVEEPRVSTVYVDATAPVLETTADQDTVPLPGGLSTTAAALTLTWLATDPEVQGARAGLAAAEYVLNGDTRAVTVPAGAHEIRTDISLAAGVHVLLLRASDRVGNVAETNLTVIVGDTQAPQTSFSLAGSSAVLGGSLFAVAGASGVLTAVDTAQAGGTATGVAATFFTIDAGPERTYLEPFALTEGRRVVAFWSRDLAGNREDPAPNAEVFVDGSAPTLSAALDQPSAPWPGGLQTVAPEALLTLSAEDPDVQGARAGLAAADYSINGQSGALVLAPGAPTAAKTLALGAGIHQVALTASDRLGLAASRSWVIAVGDILPPETVFSVEGASGVFAGRLFAAAGSSAVLTSQDRAPPGGTPVGVAGAFYVLDGAPQTAYAAPFELLGGLRRLTFHSVDLNSNAETPISAEVFVDTTPPALTFAVDAASFAIPGGFGTLATEVTLTLSAIDAEGGLGLLSVSLDGQDQPAAFEPGASSAEARLALTAGLHLIAFSAVDRLGQARAMTLRAAVGDTQAPRTTLAVGNPSATLPGGAVLVAAQTPLTLSAEDFAESGTPSGVAATLYRFTPAPFAPYAEPFTAPGPDGDKMLEFYSGDRAGNVESPAPSARLVRDSAPPDLAFAFPRPAEPGLCRLAQSPIAVRGSAADEHLASWSLKEGAALLGSGTAGGSLGTWDATGKTGAFVLTLAATDLVGNAATLALNVQAGSPARTLALGGKQVLNKPRGVAAGPNRIYVTDTNADVVRVFDAAGVPLAVLGDKKGAAKLNKPAGLVLDAAGNILVADANNKRVVKLSPAGVFLVEYGKGVLQRPVAVALSAGRLVVADAKAGQLFVFADAGTLLARVDLPPAAGPDEDPEEPRPLALAADAAGNVWCADAKGGRVLRFTPELALAQTIPGFQRPEGVAVSPSGSCLAVSDSKASRIRTFDAALSAGLAAFGLHGEIKENMALPAEFFLNKPAQLAFDAQGTLLVADRNNDLIQGFGLPGSAVVLAIGTPGRSGGGARLASAGVETDEIVASARVGRFEGGRVEHPDGTAVEVPAGAVTQDQDVSVAKAPDSGDGHRVREAARGLAGLAAASGAREFSPHGLSFSQPAVITLPYDPLLASAPRELKIHYWNEEHGAWEALTSTVDEGARTVSAQVAHFSVYQVLAPASAISTMADPDAGFAFRAIYAFPNPAVGGQRPTVHVAVGRADKVVVRFYDVAGTPVHEATLDAPSVVNDESGPHLAYEYAWTGHIPSGVYLYSVTAEKAGHAPIKRLGKLAVVR